MFTKRLFILSILLIGCFCHSSFTQERTTLRGHKGTIWSLTFSPDGKTLCSGGDDEIIIVWDIAKRQENFRISHQENPRYIVFSKNGDRLFISRTTVEVFDFTTKKSASINKANDFITHVAISPDGKIMGTGGPNNTIRIWDLDAKKDVATLKGHEGNISSVAFSPDGKTLASGSYDGTVRLWDLERKLEISRLACGNNWATPVLFSPDGDTLVSGSDGEVIVWDFKTRWVKYTLDHEDAVLSAAISPNGKILATACVNREVKLWDLASGKELWCTKHSSMAIVVAFSPDGKLLAIGGGHIIDGGEPCEVKLINVSDFVEGKKHR